MQTRSKRPGALRPSQEGASSQRSVAGQRGNRFAASQLGAQDQAAGKDSFGKQLGFGDQDVREDPSRDMASDGMDLRGTVGAGRSW